MNKKVYDVTSFLQNHPGGADILLSQGGKDATEAFIKISHSDTA
jgi:cytochrome b involved in lipid metabolism